MNYKALTINEFNAIKSKLAKFPTKGSELCFSAFLDWFEASCYADDGNAIFLRGKAGGAIINWYPVFYSDKFAGEINALSGSETEAKAAAKTLIDYAFSSLSGEGDFNYFPRELALLADEKYDIYFNRNSSDYIYDAEDFISLKGKRYHGKRNHISRFNTKYEWEFTSYSPDDYDEVILLIEAWNEFKKMDEITRETAEIEKRILSNWLKNLDSRGLFADVMTVGGKIVGVSVGEISPNNVGVVLFEKANHNYEGVYSALSNNFAKKHFSNIKYINRQEDMGIAGLRKSKLSYNPSEFADKYVVSKVGSDSKPEYIDGFFKLHATVDKSDIVFKRLDFSAFEMVRDFHVSQTAKLDDPKFFLNYKDEELAAILDGGGYFIGAFSNGELVATAAIDFDADYGDELKTILLESGNERLAEKQIYEFSGIFVREDFRGRGLAYRLTSELIKIAKIFVPSSVLCAVVQYDNAPSKGNLEKLGFKVSARKENAPYLFDYLALTL